MSQVDKIIFECVDYSLSSFEFVDKKVFYQYLEQNYKIDSGHFAENFEVVHKALKEIYGVHHYQIERVIIRILNKRSKEGLYERQEEISAFGVMMSVFIAETEKNLARNRELAKVTTYARSLERKIEMQEEKLKSAERLAAIGETAAMVGHDIRNPLQAIVGELYLEKEDVKSLPDGCSQRESLEESIKAIEENIFYINKIVSDLQDFAKPFQGEITEEVDINVVIAEALSLIPIPEKVQVQISVSKDFPMLCANFQMLKRALTNLIQNAVQAMPQGGKLTVSADCVGKKGEIVIEDTGNGIPEEVKPKIFKPLFTTKSKGQGLGLAVVKRLVEAQGGTVRFESENGDGAKFFILLPFNQTS